MCRRVRMPLPKPGVGKGNAGSARVGGLVGGKSRTLAMALNRSFLGILFSCSSRLLSDCTYRLYADGGGLLGSRSFFCRLSRFPLRVAQKRQGRQGEVGSEAHENKNADLQQHVLDARHKTHFSSTFWALNSSIFWLKASVAFWCLVLKGSLPLSSRSPQTSLSLTSAGHPKARRPEKRVHEGTASQARVLPVA